MEDDDQTRKSPIPATPIPDFAGKRGGSPIPDSAVLLVLVIGNRQIPRFPIRPGPGTAVPVPGNPGPAGGTPGISWSAGKGAGAFI